MGDSVIPEVEVLSNIIRQYFSQARSERETIQALNHLRRVLHEVSPFAQEPVDCVLWVKADEVVANDYNPNVMAPGEKRLLKQSLEKDGFTQPVVCQKIRAIIWWWMVFIVSYWAGNQIQGNA
ncbi:Co-activator of prophage gene expression IbrB [Klebsiella pneumoniae]|nr:Co-activator of prophage gene expression IbrB [Klebsiella pneumoniae]